MRWRDVSFFRLNLGAKLSAGWLLPLFLLGALLFMAILILLGQNWEATLGEIGYFWEVPLNNYCILFID